MRDSHAEIRKLSLKQCRARDYARGYGRSRWRWWLRRPVVLAVDVSGDAAAAVLWWAGDTWSHEFERWEGRWQHLGASGGDAPRHEVFRGRPSIALAGPAAILTTYGSSATKSWSGRGRGIPIHKVGWVASEQLRVAREVDHVIAGSRRIEVPPHGRVIVAWSTDSQNPCDGRPTILACAASGEVLSRLSPGSFVDSATLAAADGGTREQPL